MRLDDEVMRAARLVAYENPGANDLAYELRRDIRLDGMRAVWLSLDDVAGADASATSRTVDALVERVRSIRPTHVFLKALSDGNDDGRPDAAYFPSRHLPLRADLFAHVASRLTRRAGVQVFAWLPAGQGSPAAEVVEELAIAAPIAGLVFGGPDATAGEAGSAGGTSLLESRAEQWRPDLVTIRAVSVPAGGGAAFASGLAALASNHDFVAALLPRDDRGSRGVVDRIVADVARAPDGLDRTLFVIDAGDGTRALSAAELEAQTRRVIANGGRHVAYAKDDPLKDHPPLDPARAAISARAFPYLER
jgi:biofilm PGA synthesis lipoprotein PgaB